MSISTSIRSIFAPAVKPIGISPNWLVACLAIGFILISPILALLAVAAGAEVNVWPHLLSTVLPGAIRTTVLLMAGVGVLAAVIGTGTAWLVTVYRFPGRGILQWALVLPLAMPTYLIAFCYLEIWDYSGLLQSGLRTVFGWQSARDYWFPDIRSLSGAIFVMSMVLYPYVYLTTRASFLRQSNNVVEAARMLGCSPCAAFRRVALPLARPAISAGAVLALMECLNDIGAVEYFGVNTLTVSVYSTWLERGSLSGAAQLAVVMLLFVLLLVMAERRARGGRGFVQAHERYTSSAPIRLTGWKGWLATVLCLVPLIAGFLAPLSLLADAALVFWPDAVEAGLWRHAFHSLTLAGMAAALCLVISLLLLFVYRCGNRPLVQLVLRLSSVGYAVPGTVLAIGILAVFSYMDKAAGTLLGLSTGLVFTGTGAAMVFAYVCRFIAVSHGAVESGYARISENLDAVARTLGRPAAAVLSQVHLPLLRPAIGAGLLLVFVDSMKELPASLLLRPFNFDTLATHVYTMASLDLFEEAAMPALCIVFIGLLPVILLNRVIASDPLRPER